MDATLEILKFSLETMKKDLDRSRAEVKKYSRYEGFLLHIQQHDGRSYYYVREPGSSRYRYAGTKRNRLVIGIPFFYELPQVIGGKVFRPDFTIYSQTEDKEYFIEHFGMLSSRDYYLDAVRKICYYAENGLLPDRDVFYTYDGENGEIDVRRIRDFLSCI
jgi:hypothetical protein